MHFLQVMYQNAVTFYLKVTNKCSRQRHHSITILHNKNPSTFPKKILTKNSWHLAFFLHPAFFFFSLNSRAKKETLEINTLTQSFSASTSSSFFSLMAASFFSTFSPASALDFGFSSSFLGSGRRMTFPIFWRSCMRFMASVTWEETGEQSRCSHWAVTERISHLNAAKNYLRVTKTPINTICCKVPLWAITKFLFECLRDGGGGRERERVIPTWPHMAQQWLAVTLQKSYYFQLMDAYLHIKQTWSPTHIHTTTCIGCFASALFCVHYF